MNELIVREYLGRNIFFQVFNGEIYANVISIASTFENGKQKLEDWRGSNKTKELIEELNKINVIENFHINKIELMVSQEGIGTKDGIWIHEELFLDFSKHIDIKFRIWMDEQIITLIREGAVSLKSKTEEKMLLELFPSADNNLIALAAQNIRNVKKLEVENKVKQETIERKTEIIDNISEYLDEVRMRKIVTDYVVSYANRKNLEIKDVYNDLYSFFSRSIKTDISHAKKKYIEANRNEVDRNKEHNRKNKLKGLDRVMPCTYHKPLTVEFITNILAKGTELIYAMAKFFEVPAQQIIDKYHSVEIEEELS